MRFFMKPDAEIPKTKEDAVWKKCFAFFPVRVGDGSDGEKTYVFLEYYEKRVWRESSWPTTEYRAVLAVTSYKHCPDNRL